MAQVRDVTFDNLEDLDLGPFDVNVPVPDVQPMPLSFEKYYPVDEDQEVIEPPLKRARIEPTLTRNGFFKENKNIANFDESNLALIRTLIKGEGINIEKSVHEYFNEKKMPIPSLINKALNLAKKESKYRLARIWIEFLLFLSKGIPLVDKVAKEYHTLGSGLPSPLEKFISANINPNEIPINIQTQLKILQNTSSYNSRKRVYARINLTAGFVDFVLNDLFPVGELKPARVSDNSLFR